MHLNFDHYASGQLYTLLIEPPKYADDPCDARCTCPQPQTPTSSGGGSSSSGGGGSTSGGGSSSGVGGSGGPGGGAARQSYATAVGEPECKLPCELVGYKPVAPLPWLLARALQVGAV